MKTATLNTEVIDGFQILRSPHCNHTMLLLADWTNALKRKYDPLTVSLCSSVYYSAQMACTQIFTCDVVFKQHSTSVIIACADKLRHCCLITGLRWMASRIWVAYLIPTWLWLAQVHINRSATRGLLVLPGIIIRPSSLRLVPSVYV